MVVEGYMYTHTYPHTDMHSDLFCFIDGNILVQRISVSEQGLGPKTPDLHHSNLSQGNSLS